jgi:F-type H+-transporting ATPase subunit b
MNVNLTLVLELITFFILLFLLNKFVFRHVVKMIEQRQRYIEKNVADVEKLKKEASVDRQQAEERLAEAKRIAIEVKEDAFSLGEKLKERKAKEAEQEASRIKEKAKQEIDLYLNKVKEQLKEYSVDLSFRIARKIIEEEIDIEKHKRLVKKSLKELNETGDDRS